MSRKLTDFFIDMCTTLFVVAFIAVIVWLMVGCSTQYVPVPEYHYESHHTTDTVHRTDTITNERETIIREADSATLEMLGIKLKDGERAILVLRKEMERLASRLKESVHDTVVKTDSIRVPYPIEKQLNRWESLKMEAGGYAFALLIVAVFCLIFAAKRRGFMFRCPRDGL